MTHHRKRQCGNLWVVVNVKIKDGTDVNKIMRGLCPSWKVPWWGNDTVNKKQHNTETWHSQNIMHTSYGDDWYPRKKRNTFRWVVKNSIFIFRYLKALNQPLQIQTITLITTMIPLWCQMRPDIKRGIWVMRVRTLGCFCPLVWFLLYYFYS